jgi:hypothetical protein
MSARYTSSALETRVAKLKAQMRQVEASFEAQPLEQELKELLVRQWRLLQLLETCARSPRQLADALHVTKDQVREDLRVLERAGFPAYDYRDDYGHHWWGVLRRAPARQDGPQAEGAR